MILATLPGSGAGVTLARTGARDEATASQYDRRVSASISDWVTRRSLSGIPMNSPTFEVTLIAPPSTALRPRN